MASVLLIGTQFGFIISIVFIVLIVFMIRRKKKDQTITTQFKDEIRNSSAQRLVNLEENLASTFHLSGQETKTYSQAIIKRERKIFMDVLKIFRGEDKSLILNLHDDLKRLNQTYQDLADQLNNSGGNSSDDGAKADEKLQEAARVLKQENEALKEELQKSQESNEYLQAQYTELFDKANKDKKNS